MVSEFLYLGTQIVDVSLIPTSSHFCKRVLLLLTLRIQRHGCLDEFLKRSLIDFVASVDVDGAPDGPGLVEQVRDVLQRSTLEESELDVILVGLASADAAVVGPDWSSRIRWLHPLPLFDDIRVCLFDEFAHPAQGFAAPISEFGNPFRDLFRCQLLIFFFR